MPTPRHDVLVLLREVRDPRPPIRPEGNGDAVRETGLRRTVNPADLAALEIGVGLAAGGAVTALAAGGPALDDALRLALSMGATRAVRVWDDLLREGDAVADARVLRRVLEVVRPAVFLAGYRLLDRGDDPTAALAAAAHGMPCATAVLSCAIRGDRLAILRRAAKGARQRVEAPLPCAVLVDAAAPEPRHPELPAVLAARDAEVERWSLAELGGGELPLGTVAEEALLPRGRA